MAGTDLRALTAHRHAQLTPRRHDRATKLAPEGHRHPIEKHGEDHAANAEAWAWLFADTPAGATASARLYSLIETAKASGLEPYADLKRVFAELPAMTTADQIETLLPWNVAQPATQIVAA